MKRLLLGIIGLLIIIAGVYLLFFNESDDKTADPNEGTDKGDDLVAKKFKPDDSGETKGEIALSLEKVSADDQEADKADFRLIVKNEDDKEIELKFGSSMNYDFSITDENGKEVYRESESKRYMQVIQEVTLAPDEKKTYKVELPELDSGDYKITIMLAAKGYSDEKMSSDFTVE